MPRIVRTVTASNGVLRNAIPALEQRHGPLEYRSVERLRAYAKNPRKHSDKQIVQLMASIREFGFAVPALVDPDGTIIAGEARIAAAKRLGMKEVPVLVPEHWSKAQIRAYRLADNRLAEHATWDTELLQFEIGAILEIGETPIEILGWTTGEIDVLMDGVEDGTASDPLDEVGELPAEPTARRGDIWLLGKHRLMCASSIVAENWATLMAGQTAAMAFTDAPYNVPVNGHVSGLGKHQHAEFAMASGEMSKAEFTQFNVDYLTNLAAHTRDGGLLMACMDWRHLAELLSAAEQVKLQLLNVCVWRKANGGMGSLYRSQHEFVLILKKGKAPHTNNVELGRNGRYRTNVWDYAGANSFGATRDSDLAAHPTVKPIALVADAIRDVTRHGEIVLDAFMGSGTTILAAERTGRVAHGIEIEPGYIDVAISRWEKMAGQSARLEETGETFAQVREERRAANPTGDDLQAAA
jgi:DNA modification methylase